jgi:hypothetical protein
MKLGEYALGYFIYKETRGHFGVIGMKSRARDDQVRQAFFFVIIIPWLMDTFISTNLWILH